jgi:hypothetical protein
MARAAEARRIDRIAEVQEFLLPGAVACDGDRVHAEPRRPLASRVQLTMDGLEAYLHAVEDASPADIDFAQMNDMHAAQQSARAAAGGRSARARRRGW